MHPALPREKMLPRGDAKPRAAQLVQAHTLCPELDMLLELWKPSQEPGGT